MEKKLKDFLHFHLGCKCLTPYGVLKLNDVAMGVRYPVWFTKEAKENEEILNRHEINGKGFLLSEIKPILRPLSSMTEDEMKELYFFVFNKKFCGDNITHRDVGKKQERKVLWSGVERLFIYKDGDVGADSDLQYYPVHAPTVVRWQLSKHFDLFGLIEAGLAIDASNVS